MTDARPQRLDSRAPDFDAALDALLHWDSAPDAALARTVADLIARVRREQDAALLALTAEFDRHPVSEAAALEIPAASLTAALESLADFEREALNGAAERIRAYHRHQVQEGFSYRDQLGNELGQRVTPLQRVGVYVPGGQACYPSTVLMTVIPARVAGVDEVVMTVPTPDGIRNPLVLAAAAVAGVDRVFTVGGAQAVAALAFGTQTVPRVDKIVGPGGAFVAEAKRQVFGPVAIDMIAGPSEILIIADDSANPDWLALDLFAQAEHDAAAQAILLSPSAALLDDVHASMQRLLPDMTRAPVIAASLAARGALIHTRDVAEAIELANRAAPEHLALHLTEEAESLALGGLRHAGAIFVGEHSAEVMGDYAAGPSHVLPTFGTARYASPLGVYDFVKRSSVIRLSAEGVAPVARLAACLARGEGLDAHARAAEVRLPGFDANR